MLDIHASTTNCCLWSDTCVSSTQLIGLFGANETFLTLKSISTLKTISIYRELTMVEMLLLLTHMVVFGEMHMFHQLS
jgi:hypothetical protein